MRQRRWHSLTAILAIAALAGCSRNQTQAMNGSDSLVSVSPVEPGGLSPGMSYQSGGSGRVADTPRSAARVVSPRTPAGPRSGLVAPGTPIEVTIASDVSSKTASVGERWSGTVRDPVYRGDRLVIPAGSPVSGTVTAVNPAERGDRATLGLALSSVNVNGRSYRLHGGRTLTAGSPRKRNLGAIAGGTAAGALIGRAVGHSGKGTLVGALIGGAATSGVVAASKGYQVHLEPGDEIHFTAR